MTTTEHQPDRPRFEIGDRVRLVMHVPVVVVVDLIERCVAEVAIITEELPDTYEDAADDNNDEPLGPEDPAVLTAIEIANDSDAPAWPSWSWGR